MMYKLKVCRNIIFIVIDVHSKYKTFIYFKKTKIKIWTSDNLIDSLILYRLWGNSELF